MSTSRPQASARGPAPPRRLISRLKENLRGVPGYGSLSFLYHFVRDGTFRSDQFLRARRPEHLYQYRSFTAPDRYPRIFDFLRGRLAGQPDLRLLSFGCATGEEVWTLREYFPLAFVKGIDINPRNIAVCEARLRRQPDPRLAFTLGSDTAREDTGAYDAVFCMAVLRRAELTPPKVHRCDHAIRFADFERQVADFARCLKDGGYLAIQHTNFRVADTRVAVDFAPALRLAPALLDRSTPLFDRDNRRLPGAIYRDVVFRKRSGKRG